MRCRSMAKKKNSNYDYIITRTRYKAIKTFDHKQMESFCTDVYRSGYEDGRASVPGIAYSLASLKEALGRMERFVKRLDGKVL